MCFPILWNETDRLLHRRVTHWYRTKNDEGFWPHGCATRPISAETNMMFMFIVDYSMQCQCPCARIQFIYSSAGQLTRRIRRAVYHRLKKKPAAQSACWRSLHPGSSPVRCSLIDWDCMLRYFTFSKDVPKTFCVMGKVSCDLWRSTFTLVATSFEWIL